MLLYSLLHLTGYDVSMDDLQNFRQWGSKTPGHPEYGHTPGVETTTGPLGQFPPAFCSWALRVSSPRRSLTSAACRAAVPGPVTTPDTGASRPVTRARTVSPSRAELSAVPVSAMLTINYYEKNVSLIIQC